MVFIGMHGYANSYESCYFNEYFPSRSSNQHDTAQSKPGDLDDLYSMTIEKQHILDEANKKFGQGSGTDDFPALPSGTPLLGGGSLKPGELMTPQMLLNKPNLSMDAFARADQHHLSAQQVFFI
jgi:hypothetical protein